MLIACKWLASSDERAFCDEYSRFCTASKADDHTMDRISGLRVDFVLKGETDSDSEFEIAEPNGSAMATCATRATESLNDLNSSLQAEATAANQQTAPSNQGVHLLKSAAVLPKGTRLSQAAATEIVAHLKQSLSDNGNFSPDFSLMQNTLLNELPNKQDLNGTSRVLECHRRC